jgi:hypothetical protein
MQRCASAHTEFGKIVFELYESLCCDFSLKSVTYTIDNNIHNQGVKYLCDALIQKKIPLVELHLEGEISSFF